MRILLFTQYYTPEPPLRPSDLGTTLAERGHEVMAITGFPCYPKGEIYPGYPALGLRQETIARVKVLRLPVFPDHSRSALRRVGYYSSIALGACLAGPLVGGKFDAAFVFHPPLTLGIPAILTRWLRGVPYVYDVQDLWPESLPATGMISSPVLLSGLSRLERFNYRHAAAISVISPGFKQNLIGKGVPAEKIQVIPNWADEAIYRPVPKDPTLAEALNMAGRFNIVYGGNMGLPQMLTNVIEAAERLQDLPDVQFVFVGDGVQKQELEETVARKGLHNVVLVGRKTPQEMASIFALADILLIHLRKDPLFAITIPGKTIAYLASGRPILAAVEGDAAEVVTDAEAGIACPPGDPLALAERVRWMYALPVEQRERMGECGRQAFLAQFTRKILVDRFERLFEAISNSKKR